MTMSLTSQAAYVNVNGSIWLKGHIAPYFNHLDLGNGMMPLLMPSATCDTDISGNGICD